MESLAKRVSLTLIFFMFTSLISAELLEEYRYCSRPCVPGSAPKRCRYKFFVSELRNANSLCHTGYNNESIQEDCQEKSHRTGILVINGISPGPSIEVCLGDTVEVTVTNGLGRAEVSLHWHGVRQRGSAHMDGVSMITQCPIMPFSSFRYEFNPDIVGSHLYYAHSVLQQGDGIYGALIVRGPENIDILEKTLLISTKLDVPLSRLWPSLAIPTDIFVNGKKNGISLSVNENRRYILRLINANAVACPVNIHIAQHVFEVVRLNGQEVTQKLTGSNAVIFPGERFDIVVEMNQPSSRYPIHIYGLGACRGIIHTATLDYKKSDDDHPSDDNFRFSKKQLDLLEKGYGCQKVVRDTICSLDVNIFESIENDPDETIYVSFDMNSMGNIADEMSDFRYNFYGYTHYPTYLSLSSIERRVFQVSGMTFKYPPSPILSQPENTPQEIICSLDSKSDFCTNTPRFCECLQIIEVPANRTVEMVLIDEGFGNNISHTFHVHGYRVNIVGVGSFGKAITKNEIMVLDQNSDLPRNLKNHQQSDTFNVPNKGYIILRFYTDNIGYWLWEDRATGTTPLTFGPGMQFLLQVGSRQNMPTVPINFPSCGSNKGPDFVFEDN